MGWFIDIFIEFFYRALVRMWKIRGVSNWPLAKATVTSSACPTAFLGCPVAEIYYIYLVNGEKYTGLHKRAFIVQGSGELYADLFPPSKEISIRLKPCDPATSLVLEDDQLRNANA
jgi:hypothetical protein